MKRALSLTLAVVMLCALAACGGNGTPTQAPSVELPSVNMPTNYNPAPTGSTSTEAPEASSEEAKYGGVVRFIDTGSNGGTAEPFGVPWTPVLAKGYSVVWSENLVNFTQDGIYEPHLATDWDINMDPDVQTITFQIREGIKFTDGSPLNAEAVAWNINRWPEDGKGDEGIDKAWTDGEYTVVVHYFNLGSVLFETFASHSYSIISMKNFLDNGKEYAMQHPVGTGPFILDEWIPGTSIKFTRNPDYWMEGRPYLDGVEYYEISDIMTQNAALISEGDGAIDMFAISNVEQVYTLLQAGTNHDTSYMRGSGTFVLGPSSNNPDSPFADLKVRQAVSYAIDREAIAEAKGFGIMKPAYQITAAGYAGHLPEDSPNLASYDLEKAKALMVEAGYENGFNTTLYATPAVQDAMVIIQAQLEEIGIHCELETPEPGRMSDLQINGWEGLYAFNFGQVMNTGISYFIWYHPNQNSYVSAYRPEEYEELFLEARGYPEIDDGLFGNLSNLLLDNMIYVPVYHNYSTYFVRNGLVDHGYHKYSSDTIWAPWAAYWEEGSPRLG